MGKMLTMGKTKTTENDFLWDIAHSETFLKLKEEALKNSDRDDLTVVEENLIFECFGLEE